MKAKFYGASDDLVEIEGNIPMLNGMDKGSGTAEWGACGNDPNPVAAKFHIVGPSKKCKTCGRNGADVHLATVFALYDGQWTFAVAMGREDENGKYTWPENWDALLCQREDHDYSMELTIDTGKDKVGILNPDYEGDDD